MDFLPKNVFFFHLFDDLADLAQKTARVLAQVKLGKTLEGSVKKAAKLEHEADNICHEIYYQAGKAFVTPIDREDIQLLGQTLDNIIDLQENAISNLYLYRVRKLTPEYRAFGDLIEKTVKEVVVLIAMVKHKSRYLEKMRGLIVKVHSLENDGDKLMRQAFKKLFARRQAMEVIKWKDLYENLESVLDECEDIADTVETIIVKNF